MLSWGKKTKTTKLRSSFREGATSGETRILFWKHCLFGTQFDWLSSAKNTYSCPESGCTAEMGTAELQALNGPPQSRTRLKSWHCINAALSTSPKRYRSPTLCSDNTLAREGLLLLNSHRCQKLCDSQSLEMCETGKTAGASPTAPFWDDPLSSDFPSPIAVRPLFLCFSTFAEQESLSAPEPSGHFWKR